MRRMRRDVDKGGIAKMSQIAGGMESKTREIVKADVPLVYTQIDAKDLHELKAGE